MFRLYAFFNSQLDRLLRKAVGFFRPGSIRRLFSKSFLLLSVLFVLLFLGSCFYFSYIMRRQVYDSTKETMELYNDQLQQHFQETLIYLSENCLQNTDLSILNTSQSTSERYLRTARLKKSLSTGICSMSSIDGLFMYFSSQDIYIPQINNFWDNDQNNQKCSALIRSLMQEAASPGSSDSSLNEKNWFLLSDQDTYFLVRVIRTREVYAGAWININKISSSFEFFEDIGATILFVDSQGNCFGNSDFTGISLDPVSALEKVSYSRDGSSRKYFTVSVKLADCDYYIMALIPLGYTEKKLAPLYGLMVFILFLLMLFCTIVISSMSYFFNAPTRILTPVIQSLRNGKFESKIETEHHFQEIRNITEVFNDMISEIQNLRIHIYEEQLSKKKLELQYLRTQVAPHFLINCLNTIFVLSQDPGKQKLTHRFIQTLSEHLRYTLATHSSVSLQEELYYTKNYLKLTQLRFPGTLTYRIRTEAATGSSQVFPMILLMLTENAIKANVVMGERFLIQIQGYVYEKNGQQRVHLTHIDSGNGFDTKSLELYNHITEHPEIQKNGYGIGIYNTVMRLRLTFGDSASFLFSNEPGLGARIDFDFPYLLCPKEDTGSLFYDMEG